MVAPSAFVIALEVAGVAAVVLIAMSRRRGRTAGAALDVPERIQAALTDARLPASLARALATETAVFYYALFAWRSRPFVPAGAKTFSYHRRNAYAATLYAVVGAALVEMAVVDLLVRARHSTAANALLFVDALAAIWILGFARSVQLRPILITGDSLFVRNGLVASIAGVAISEALVQLTLSAIDQSTSVNYLLSGYTDIYGRPQLRSRPTLGPRRPDA